jgi:branched-subunit amino acid ABC-type transport system permease component
MGLCDGIISVAFGPAAASIVPLILIILILIIRPEGIFGHE